MGVSEKRVFLKTLAACILPTFSSYLLLILVVVLKASRFLNISFLYDSALLPLV